MSDKPFQVGKVLIKVFIDNEPSIHSEITSLIQAQFPTINASDMKSNLSANKNFLSLTYEIYAKEDDEQKLNQLYTSLSKHPKVKMVL